MADLHEERGRTFRSVAAEVFVIHSNLSLANMNFADLAQAVNPDGIYTGL